MEEAKEYLIDFDTRIEPGKIRAVRVRLDLVTIGIQTFKDIIVAAEQISPDAILRVDLCDHPLYDELQRYVKGNPK